MSDQRPIIIWLNVALIALTLAAIASRVGRRVFLVGTFGWHDALISLAAVSATVFSILQMVGTNFGLGRHQADVSDAVMHTLIKLVIASNVFYFLCNWAVKHALLLFYAEIVCETHYRCSIYFMHFIAFGFGTSSILVNLFQCRPFNKAWQNEHISGYCVDLTLFFYANASIMLATDVVLYIMPVVFTWNLQLRRAQRVGLNALFALGGLVLAASAARVYSVYMFATHPDFPWRFANAMMWAVIENHIAIVVACAPSVRVIAPLVFPRLASSLRSMASKVTPSSSFRSRSRASIPVDIDLESGVTRKSDRLKPTPAITPMPSPAITSGGATTTTRQSKVNIASSSFAKWFNGPASATLGSGDSMEGRGLVHVEDLSAPGKDVKIGENMPSGDTDIRVQYDIRVESSRQSTES